MVMKMTVDQSDLALKRDDLTLSSRLISAMRKAILDGRLEPGRHLKERELCEMFRVSRSLVREAVQKLAAEELITVIPHRGLMVSLLDRKSARDLYKVRAVLEGLACAEFAEHADEADREDLFVITARLQQLSESDQPQTLIEAKNDFYGCLLRGCKNETLAQMFTQLNNRIVRLRRLSLSQKGRLPVTIKEITAIVEAIKNRDPAAARRLGEAHVAAAAKVAEKQFDELEQAKLK